MPSEGAFNEQSLRQAIVNTWGPAGAHADVYDHILRRLALAEDVVNNLPVPLDPHNDRFWDALKAYRAFTDPRYASGGQESEADNG